MIKLILLALGTLPSYICAQQQKAFRIVGHSAFYNNKQLVIQGGVLFSSYPYNDFSFVNDKTDTAKHLFKLIQVQDNQFIINGFQKYPHPFQIAYYNAETKTGRSSDFFFADAGTFNIKLNELSGKYSLDNIIHSKSNIEYQHLKRFYSNAVDTLTGKILDFKAKQNILNNYIARNPGSYVALWDMVIDYVIMKNYKDDSDLKLFLKNAKLFSTTIKNTTTYKTFLQSLEKDLEVSTGKIFPNFLLNSPDSLIPIVKKNKFTLVDIWASWCSPCIAQFPAFKTMYEQNNSKGFEIIAISVDEKEAPWQKTIQTHELKWIQYRDADWFIGKQLNIRSYPSNYLLDHEGKVIKVNIEPEDLEMFLQQNLH